jgi:hypothetical protein
MLGLKTACNEKINKKHANGSRVRAKKKLSSVMQSIHRIPEMVRHN